MPAAPFIGLQLTLRRCNSLYTYPCYSTSLQLTHRISLQLTQDMSAIHSICHTLDVSAIHSIYSTSLQLTHCISLYITVNHWISLQHSRRVCNSLYIWLQLGATGCLPLHHDPYKVFLVRTLAYICCNTLLHTATHCNTLRLALSHCNTLQHTMIHCNTL